jgi:small-conductance mechanosensitive channel
LIERPISVGDWVVIGEHEGRVKRISFRSTEIETWQRASVIIPNADILSKAVVNWTLNDRTGRIEIPVGVAYGSDTAKVRDTLVACARAHPRILADPPPVALFRAFADSSLNFELRCFTDNVMERLAIASDLLFDIDRRFREEGIEIPFPQQVVHHADPPPGRG